MCRKGYLISQGHKFNDDVSDLVIKQVEPMFPNLRMAMLFGDGEPMLYKGFWSLVENIREHAPHCAIDFITNGTLMTEKNIDRCFHYNISHIGLSLAGATAITHNSIRCGSDLDGIVDAFVELNNRKKKKVQYPYISAFFIVMRDNIHEIPDFVRLARDVGFLDIIFQKMWVTHDGLRNQVVEDEEVRPYFAVAVELARKFGIGIDHYPLAVIGQPYRNAASRYRRNDLWFHRHWNPIQNTGYCAAQQPWNSVYVLQDGSVVPDCHWWSSCRRCDLNTCGKLDVDTNIVDIWNGPVLQEIRSNISRGVILPQCRGCGLAGGVLPSYRCKDTDHYDPLLERL